MKVSIKIIIWLPLLLAVVFVFYKIVQGLKETSAGLSELLNSTYTLQPLDSTLFKTEAMENISVFEVLRSKVRNPISLMYYKEYNIIFFRIDLINDNPINSILSLAQNKSKSTTDYSYRIVAQHNYFDIRVKTGTILPASRLYFSYFGDSFITEFENDSIASYRFSCDNFSIKYQEDGPVDFFAEKKTKKSVPVNILFWRRDKAVYFFLMTPGKMDVDMHPNMLLDILNINP